MYHHLHRQRMETLYGVTIVYGSSRREHRLRADCEFSANIWRRNAKCSCGAKLRIRARGHDRRSWSRSCAISREKNLYLKYGFHRENSGIQKIGITESTNWMKERSLTFIIRRRWLCSSMNVSLTHCDVTVRDISSV